MELKVVYWCKKCNEPIYNKQMHECTCSGKTVKISEGTVCNPVFIQEKKLLSKIIGKSLIDKKIWYFGFSKYFYDEYHIENGIKKKSI